MELRRAKKRDDQIKKRVAERKESKTSTATASVQGAQIGGTALIGKIHRDDSCSLLCILEKSREWRPISQVDE